MNDGLSLSESSMSVSPSAKQLRDGGRHLLRDAVLDFIVSHEDSLVQEERWRSKLLRRVSNKFDHVGDRLYRSVASVEKQLDVQQKVQQMEMRQMEMQMQQIQQMQEEMLRRLSAGPSRAASPPSAAPDEAVSI